MSNSYVNKIKVGADTHLIQPTLYKNSAGTASAITAAVSDFVLIEGATVYVKITTTNNANATLNVNSTGAKAIQYNGTAITANVLKVNHIYNFVYDGTNWQLIGDLDTNLVTGVKGDSESNYRTGNVNITKTNIGLGNVENTKLSTWTGSGNITTIGTLSSGTVPWARLSGVPTATTDTAGITTVGASGGAAAYSHNHDGVYAPVVNGGYLPLSGGTMTGAINTYHPTDSTTTTTPVITLRTNNRDVFLFQVGHATSVTGNFSNNYKLKYNGSLNTPNNYLELLANNGSEDTIAIQINETGIVKFPGTFNYTGITTGDTAIARPIWFGAAIDNNTLDTGRPVYDNDFKYNPNSNTLTIGTGTLTATNYSGKAATAGTADSANAVAWSKVSEKPTKITLTGSVTGSVSLGSGELTLATTTNHNHDSAYAPIVDGGYLPKSGGQMTGTAKISWADSGTWGDSSAAMPVKRGGLYWSGTSDWIELFAEETGRDNFNLIMDVGDDASPSLILRNRGTATITLTPGSGVVSATSFSGSGASLTSLNASNLSSGTVPSARLPVATSDAFGAIKIGSGITNTDGVISVSASNLGLSSALRYQGTTTTTMEDGRTTAAVTIGGDSFTPIQGDVVIYNDAEYVWTGSLWELLGAESSFKKVQTAVNSSSASGNSATTFVSSITQDTQGVITVKTSTLDTSGTWNGTANTATTAKYTKQYYTVNSTDAPLQVRSNNKNVYIWQAGHAASESGGFSNNYALQYYGEGSSPNNYLILKTSNSSTVVDAIKIDELGNTTFANTILGTIKHVTAAHWSTTAGSPSGVLKVKIKKKTSWMLAFTIRVYQEYDYTDIGISGYNYGSRLWYSPKARIISSTSTNKLTVSFGYDDDAVDDYRTLWVSIPVKQYTGIDIFNVTNGYTQIDLSDAFEIIQETTSTGTVQATTDVYRPLYRDDSLETTNLAGDVFKWQTTSLASTALYDFGAYVAQNTAGGTGPNGSNYYNLINIPYRKASGNTKLDWGWQLGNTTSNDNRLYYRTTGDNTAGNWQTIAHATTSSDNTGSARQPVYMTSAGTITTANYTVAHFGNAGKSNMNDIGRLHASTGMTALADPDNNNDNPMNGSTKSTSWHLYWNTNYKDDPNDSNAWVAQIVNKAGTSQWWVRSRSGGTITNGTAWASNWRHLVTSAQAGVGGTGQPVYVDENGELQACTSYTDASVNYATSAENATTANKATAANLTTTTNALTYYTNETGAFGNASKITVYNNVDVTVQNAAKKRNGLRLSGTCYGNTATDLTSNTVGVMRYEDGGVRIEFSADSSDNAALLYTNHDKANTGGGSSFHFVGQNGSNDTGGNLAVTAPDFVARRRLMVGKNFTDASYTAYINGTSYLNGATTINYTTAASSTVKSGQLIVQSGTGSNAVAIELYRNTSASWQIVNTSGMLQFNDNYTTSAQNTYTNNCFSMVYNTGNATFKGSVTASSFIGNASSATGVIDAGNSSRVLTIRYGGNGAAATDWIPMHDSSGNLVPVSSTNLANKVRDKASGDWGISITGSAASATRLAPSSITSLSSFTHSTDLIYAVQGGSNSVADKPTDVDAFGVLSLKTANVWYGQLLMSSDSAPGLYWRTATSLNAGWNKVLDSANYSSYALPLSGGTLGKSNTIDNTTFKNILILYSNQSNESTTTSFDATKSSWGIGFQRKWNNGTEGAATHAGIYAYGISDWRTGLVFRTKTGSSSSATHDVSALILNHNADATFSGNISLSDATKSIARNGSSINWNQANTRAMIRMITKAGWSPLFSLKADTGWWNMGHYNSSGFNNHLLFTFLNDNDVSGVSGAQNHMDYTVRLIPVVHTDGGTTDRVFVTAPWANSKAAVGSSTQPIYIDDNGVAAACTSYTDASVNYAASAGSATTANTASNITTTNDTSSTLQLIGVDSSTTTLLKRNSSITMVGSTLNLQYINLSGNQAIIIKKMDNYTGGWARSVLEVKNTNDEILTKIGVYGSNNTLNYMYIGSNAYDGANLYIYPNGTVKAIKFNSSSTPVSWINGQKPGSAAYDITDYGKNGHYFPWMRATDTDAARDASDNKIGRYFSFGTLATSFYWMGSINTRTSNGYDHALHYDTSTGKLYCDETEVSLSNHTHNYLPLSGGTMTGQIVLASTGYKTSNTAGYSVDQYGNFKHQTTTATNTFEIQKNNGTATFKVTFESGEVTATKYVIDAKVRLEYNSTDDSLDFVFI